MLAILLVILGGLTANAQSYNKIEVMKAIKVSAKKYNLDSRLLATIAHVESSFGKNSRLKKNRNGTHDIGLFQINSVHWDTTCKAFNLLKLQGNTDCAALILSKHVKYSNIDPYWFGRYHSNTNSRKMDYVNKIMINWGKR